MKKTLSFFLLTIPSFLYCQVLVESIKGEDISLYPNNISNILTLGGVNISEQSIKLKLIYPLANKKYLTFGIEGKPSNGILSILSGGNISPSTKLSLVYTKKNIFSSSHNIFDFFSIYTSYSVNKYTIISLDTIFEHQVNNKTFRGGSILFNYNAIINGKHLISLIIGNSRENNYSKLNDIVIKDYKVISDPKTGYNREISKTSINGKSGKFEEYDRYPVRIGYTLCPPTDLKGSEKARLGYTCYYSCDFGKTIPIHNIGTILLYTTQDKKTGVRTPLFGFGVQANDISDNLNKKTSLMNRLTVNLSTTIVLANL